jgi:acyl carrier protein
MQADVTDEAALTAVFAQIRRSLPPLRAIFHAAGVLDDGILRRQTAERFTNVLAPKVRGAWLLHRLTLSDPLDHFVLFSSIAAVFGSPGQGNHAAANAFLDGLAHYRRRQGLPALSINWGAWSEVGAAVGKQSAERIAAAGMTPITSRWGVAALGKLLQTTAVQTAIVAVDWPRWFQNYPAGRKMSLLAHLATTAKPDPAETQAEEPDSIVARLKVVARPQERREHLENFLRRQAAHVLRQSPGKIDAHTPFGSLGFDSLMGLEFKNNLEQQLGLTLPVSLVWNYPTVAETAVYIAQQLNLSLEQPAENTTAVTEPEDARAAELAELSEEDVLQMLQEKLKSVMRDA